MFVIINFFVLLSKIFNRIKAGSSSWINKKQFVKGNFSWQEGYGAFSYGRSQIKDVAQYIENQKSHHKKRTFAEEYLEFLKLFEIEYDERYVLRNSE